MLDPGCKSCPHDAVREGGAKWRAMEVIRTLGGVMGSIKMLVDLIAKNRELALGVASSLKSMNKDFEMIHTVRLERKQEQLQLTPGMQLLLQELAYDIDDFIQGLWVPGEPGSFILSAIGADSRPQIIQRIQDFKETIKNLKEELPKSFEAMPPASPSSFAGSPIAYASEVDLVGIERPKKKIVELLAPRLEPHVGRLSVISIVGCSGSGKTSLARALYQDELVTKDFDYKAWVVASDPCSVDTINKLRKEVVLTSAPGSSPEAFHHFQKDKRYLLFVDDVLGEKPWKDIRNAFSENVMDSRIIVTTRVPSVARDYSAGSYEYTMPGLDQENSRKLFRVKFRGIAGYTEEDEHRLGNNDVDIIIDKCDGLPIALISAAECLRRKGLNPGSGDFKQVAQELRDRLACCDSAFEEFQKQNGTDTTFAEMRRARVEPYENLLNHGEKECLLYVSIFPCGHQINIKNLVRRLIAEGLVPGDPDIVKASESVEGDVRECVRKLLNQQMVEPVPIRNYSNVAKRCRVHSIMLQFTIKKAVSRNFVSLIDKDQPLRSTTGLVRRLTVQSSPLVQGNTCPEGMDLSVLRSLAIFNSRNLDFEQCRLVRVLDLEGCHHLTQKDLCNICGLVFLKYLSLRNTDVLELPDKVKELMFLETLDTRDTRGAVVIKLPVEVLMLPRFAYLFGKFELTNVQSNNTKKLTKYFSEKKSQLHTLGGIAIDEIQGLEIVLLVVQHATKLRKVKVWYRDTPEPIPRASTRGLFTHRLKLFGLFSRWRPSARPSANTSSNAHDPALLASGKQEPIACPSRQGVLMHKKKHFWLCNKRKLSAGPAANPTSTTHDPSPATSTAVASGTSVLPCAGPLPDSSSNTQDPAQKTSTPVASGTLEPFPCVGRLAKTLKERCMTLASVSIDFNCVTNTFLDFLEINGAISSMKLWKVNGVLPNTEKLGQLNNLKKLHLFSTGLKSEQLASLQHLKCLQYLKLVEEGHGIWDSVFHVQVGGFISLIWMCFEASNSKHPPLKIDQGVKTPIASLLLLCKESYPRVEGISHLAKLNEVILHPDATYDEVTAWKREAEKHINRPYVEKQKV